MDIGQAFDLIRMDIQRHAAERDGAVSRRAYAEAINDAYEVIQRHVGLGTAIAIGQDLMALLDGPDEYPGEVTDPAETSRPDSNNPRPVP